MDVKINYFFSGSERSRFVSKIIFPKPKFFLHNHIKIELENLTGDF
jgi:hypothetical protein